MKKVVIYPAGFGMFFMFVILGFFFFAPLPIMAIGVFVLKSSDLNVRYVVLGFGLLAVGVYEIYQMFFNSKVIFEDSRFIFNAGGAKDKDWFPAINIDCKELVDFNYTYIITFTKNNGQKVLFGTVRFSRKQIIRILKEIQFRGGLQEVDIDEKMNIKKGAKKND